MIFAAALLLQAAPLPADAVRPSLPSREFDGVWLDEFEGQQFFEGAVAASDLQPFGAAPWIDIDRSATLNAMLPAKSAHDRIVELYKPRLYRIRFIGKVAPAVDCRPQPRQEGHLPLPPPLPGCIGIGGMFPGRIIAQRVLALEDLGPLPAGGQKWSLSSDNRH